jgi:tRNA A-37 threonylcarbamoyl transferase component Bud32
MASPNWQKIQELFQKCVDKSTEQQREILQNECGDDVELIREVQKLLAGDNSAKSQFLEWPDGRSESSGDGDESEPTLEHDSRQDEVSESGFPATKTAVSPNSGQLRQIGPYKLLEEIGHGGMGEVWLAQQTEPVSRRVAIKLIKSQLTGRMEVARFEAERQALALMDHPNIAKVFDAGTTEDGLPYYVMEFINGISVTEYCDEHQLSIRDRLQVFIPICRAIQHAHQKGIIHRDLKPSNILVGESEGFPIPKVIDFGLAKATDHQRLLTDKTLFTEIGKVVGTLQYMSPEQAALNSNDIDSRTDVYLWGLSCTNY